MRAQLSIEIVYLLSWTLEAWVQIPGAYLGYSPSRICQEVLHTAQTPKEMMK